MQNRRWWGVGLLGIALAGTIALVIPSEAQTGAMGAGNDFGAPARQPDRAVQQEAQAIANRIEAGMRRSASLLSTLADGDLTVFDRDRVALNAASSQWPIALFTAAPGKGSDFGVQPPGERFLGPEDVVAIQKQDVWISERSPLKSVLVAVPSRTGQVLASRVPYDYFSAGLNAIPRANGVRRYLLDAGGKPLSGEVAPNGEDRDWCQQLLQLGEGFLATSDAMFAVARVPATGWAVVVRHPIGHTSPVVTFDAGMLGGPTMVASGPLHAPGLPKGIFLYPLAGAALLFGLAIVGWKQRWPGLEDGPIAFGEHAFKSVTAPLRDRFDRRTPAPEALPPSGEMGLAAFGSEVPSKLPAAIAGGDVDFLRTEQVRNLRELWSHTEERLSGQRNWVRDEVRRVQDSTTTSISELGSIVNLAEQRLEDARAAWSDVQSSLLARIDEARGGILSEQELQEEFRSTVEGQLADLRSALAAEQDAREDQGKRLARGLGDLANGLETEFAAEREAQQASSARLGTDLEALSTLMNEEFARLEGVVQESRALLTELDAREADSRNQWQAAMAAHAEHGDRLTDELARTRETLALELVEQAAQLQRLVTETQERLREEMSTVGDRTRQLGEEMSTVNDRTRQLGEEMSTVNDRTRQLGEEISTVSDRTRQLGEEMTAVNDRSRELGNSFGDLEERLLELGQRMDKRYQDLEATRRSFDARVEAANARVLDQADELEETNERLYGLGEDLDRLSEELENAQDALGTRQTSLEARLNEQLGDLSRAREQNQELDRRLSSKLDSLDHRSELFESQALQRMETGEAKIAELMGKVSEHDRFQGELKGLPSEFAGLKGRLEGMSLAHARQQEALNAAVQQITGLQRAVETKASDTAIQDQVEGLTRFVQQLAEQSQLLAQALDASTTAASRTEHWLGEQLSVIRNEQADAVSALSQENAALRESLHALKEGNEALSSRMHMVVQVLSKISR